MVNRLCAPGFCRASMTMVRPKMGRRLARKPLRSLGPVAGGRRREEGGQERQAAREAAGGGAR